MYVQNDLKLQHVYFKFILGNARLAAFGILSTALGVLDSASG